MSIFGLYRVEKWSYEVGFVGTVRSVLAIGEWAESHWIIGAISFHKIYGLYSVEHHKVEKWP